MEAAAQGAGGGARPRARRCASWASCPTRRWPRCRARPTCSCSPPCSRPRPRWPWRRWPAARRVVSTDNPGGLELRGDLRRRRGGGAEGGRRARWRAPSSARLAAPRRASAQTARRIAERFRLDGVAERYLGLYAEALRVVRTIDEAALERGRGRPLPQRIRLRGVRVPAQRQGDPGPGARGGERRTAACSTRAAAAAAPRSRWPRSRPSRSASTSRRASAARARGWPREKGVANAAFVQGDAGAPALPRRPPSTSCSATP